MKSLLMSFMLLLAQSSLAAGPIAKEPKAEPPCPFRQSGSLQDNTAAVQKQVRETQTRGGRDGQSAARKKQ